MDTPWKINMEQNHRGLVQIIFLSKWVICMFHVNLPGCICFFEKKTSGLFSGGICFQETLEGKIGRNRNLGDLYDRFRPTKIIPLILEFSIYKPKYNKWSYVFVYTHVDM